jgi:hypothetical protein
MPDGMLGSPRPLADARRLFARRPAFAALPEGVNVNVLLCAFAGLPAERPNGRTA